jgi:hypothetical protein
MVKDFSIKENPNGVWAYWDYIDNTPLAYSRRSYKGVKGFECWTNDQLRPDRLTIGINKTGQTLTLDNGNFVLPPGYVMIDPEHDADAYVLFTAPVSGRYTINGASFHLHAKKLIRTTPISLRLAAVTRKFGTLRLTGTDRSDSVCPSPWTRATRCNSFSVATQGNSRTMSA